jgi:hypothetical protein
MADILGNIDKLDAKNFQEELARTYFSTTSSREKNLQKPDNNKIKKGVNWAVPGMIIAGLILGFAAILFFINRTELNSKAVPAGYSPLVDKKIQKIDMVYLDKDGSPNTDLIKNVVFYENAGGESAWQKQSVILSNENPTKKAVLGIDFKNPLNLSETLFCFYSKGEMGQEEFRISLRDTENNSCNSIINKSQNAWQQFIVDAVNAKYLVDLKNITHIDLEVNPAEKQNLNRSTVYFKEICLTKKGEG